MVSSTSAAYDLTVNNAASGPYALTVMTVVTVVFLPLVLLYQGWSFYVFRGPRADAPGARGRTRRRHARRRARDRAGRRPGASGGRVPPGAPA